jgi:hypothetical protein
MKALRSLAVGLLVAFGAVAFIWVTTTALAQEAAQGATEAAKPGYIGSDKCKLCHKGAKKGEVYEKWEASAHAKAFTVLPEASQKDASCLACHSTGFGKGGFVAGAEGAEVHANVGCEACHGPGSEYKSNKIMKDREASVAAGLIIPKEETCAGCHAAEIPKACWAGKDAAPKFVFAEAFKTIEHKVPKVAAE